MIPKKLNTSLLKTHSVMWVFLFLVSTIRVSLAQESIDHGIEDLGYKMVYLGNENPFTVKVDSNALIKYELIKKRSEWTREQKTALDSLEVINSEYQARILFEKYLTLHERSEFETHLSNSEAFVQWQDSVEKNSGVYEIKFIQAFVLDSSITASEVEAVVSNFDPKSKKKGAGPIQVNFEQLSELGDWHQDFQDLISAPLKQMVQSTRSKENSHRRFFKVLERQRKEKSDLARSLAKKHFTDDQWSRRKQMLYSNSSHSKIELSPSYFSYSKDGVILKKTDTLAISDSISIQLSDIIGHQAAYERFVLNPDAAIMKQHIKDYLIVPYLIAQGSSYSRQDSLQISRELLNALEIKYRSEVLFTTLSEDTKPDSSAVMKHYQEHIDRFKEYGSCSFLVAYVESPEHHESAQKHLADLQNSGEYDANTKLKQAGYTIKYEENYSLNQMSDLSQKLRNADVGKAFEFAGRGDKEQSILLVEKDLETLIPIEKVYSQLTSELTQIRAQEIERNLKELK